MDGRAAIDSPAALGLAEPVYPSVGSGLFELYQRPSVSSLDLRRGFPYTSEGLPGSRARVLWTGETFSHSCPPG